MQCVWQVKNLTLQRKSGLWHIVTSGKLGTNKKKHNVWNSTDKKKILNLIPCASLCLNSPYLIYYYFSGKNNNIVGCTSTHSLYNCAQGGDNQKPGINVSFRFTVKLSLKSLNTKEHCSISWLLLTKGVLKKHIQDWITSGNGTLTETIGGEMRQLCVIKTSVDMAILWFPGAWHTDCRWISAR